MKVWLKVVRRYHDEGFYPRRWFVVIRSCNGRDLMSSKGYHTRRAQVVLAKKLSKHLNIEYRGRQGD